MGLLDIFGGKKEYPELGQDSSAAQQLANIQASLETLVSQIPDKLEVIPDNDAAFVFIGKPPKKFGVAWIEDGQVKNLQALAQEKGIQPMALQGISEKLRSAYERNQDVERFSTEIGGKSVVVTPSEALKEEVADIINRVVN